MKKLLLSTFALVAATSLSATQYMHVNLDNGKEYDVKIEKTDRVCHVDINNARYIKVIKKDSTYSLYPLSGSEVSFDNEIAKENDNISRWNKFESKIEGCTLDTVGFREKYPDIEEYVYSIEMAIRKYQNCINAKKEFNSPKFSDTEKWTYQNKANTYAAELLKKVAKPNNNTIISPLSLQMAMALLANGADLDEAYDEVTDLLGCKGLELDSLNSFYQRKLKYYRTLDPSKVKIGLANACFLQDGIQFGKNFLQNMDEFYSASVNNVDFSQDSTYEKINKWAADNTDSMICKLPIDNNPLNVFVLGNALIFKSQWGNMFSENNTKKGSFTNALGKEIMVDKMQNYIEGSYQRGQNYEKVSLPFYENFEMDVFLPNIGVSTDEVLPVIDWGKPMVKQYSEDMTDFKADTVYMANVKLPKFNIDNTLDLRESLINSGIKTTFEEPFGRITNKAVVSTVRQVTHLEIDEEGAKGAAVTVIIALGEGMSVYKDVNFDVNRPFIVTIRNTDTNDLLFLGVINDPTEK